MVDKNTVQVYSDANVRGDVMTVELSVTFTLHPKDRTKTFSSLLTEIEAVMHQECTAPMLAVTRRLLLWMDGASSEAPKPITGAKQS